MRAMGNIISGLIASKIQQEMSMFKSTPCPPPAPQRRPEPVTTGNVAFDEFKASEIKRIEEERRKLDVMQAEFVTYLRELEAAKDRQEFDAFMAAKEPKP